VFAEFRKALRLSSGSRCTLVSYSPKLSYDPAHVNLGPCWNKLSTKRQKGLCLAPFVFLTMTFHYVPIDYVRSPVR
ncbi:hypothetical protein, partial [Leptospira alexanderi]|uniref:hypothetical protein n=1 Tax=Leptospira alexanderi TaxID=100053 RepID=UPI000991200D